METTPCSPEGVSCTLTLWVTLAVRLMGRTQAFVCRPLGRECPSDLPLPIAVTRLCLMSCDFSANA